MSIHMLQRMLVARCSRCSSLRSACTRRRDRSSAEAAAARSIVSRPSTRPSTPRPPSRATSAAPTAIPRATSTASSTAAATSRSPVCANSTLQYLGCNSERRAAASRSSMPPTTAIRSSTPSSRPCRTRINSDIAPFPTNDADTLHHADQLLRGDQGPVQERQVQDATRRPIRIVTESTVTAGKAHPHRQGQDRPDLRPAPLRAARLRAADERLRSGRPLRQHLRSRAAADLQPELRGERVPRFELVHRTRGTSCSKPARSPAISSTGRRQCERRGARLEAHLSRSMR